MLHQFRHEPEAALSTAEKAGKICAEYRFDYYGAWSSLIRAWAVAELGQLDEGLTAYHIGLEKLQLTGARVRMPHYLGLLAELYGKAGDIQTAMRLIAEAIAIRDLSRETWCSAELQRAHGELLLISASDGAQAQADAAFRGAIETASSQGAKLLQLRAMLAYARFQVTLGNLPLAREMLMPFVASFTEGFDTRDLKEAKALVVQLG
jgi:predicted ATPase